MNNLIDSNPYDAQQTSIDIIKTYTEFTRAVFNSYPDALRLFSAFCKRTVVNAANSTLLATEETQTIHIPQSSEGAVNAMATGPTFTSETAEIQFRFYKNQFDIDEDVITVPTAIARIRLSLLAIVFAVELQSPLEVFRALRGAPHSQLMETKKIRWVNMIRQIGAGMLRDPKDDEGNAKILALRSLLVTAERDFSDLPRDQLYGLIVDWKTAGSIGMTTEINNSNDLLKLTNPTMFKTPMTMRVGDVVVDSIPPIYSSQIQQDTALTMEHPLFMSFAGFVSIKNTFYADKPIRLYIPDYRGGSRYIVLPATGPTGHNGDNLLVVIRRAKITGSSHIVVFGKDEPVSLAETAQTKVRGGDGNDRDAKSGMAFVQASRWVGATCTRPNNVVEFLSRIVRNIEVDFSNGDKDATEEALILDYADGLKLQEQSHNVFIFRMKDKFLPEKDVFDLMKNNSEIGNTYSRNFGLFAENKTKQYWNAMNTALHEEYPLGYALSMPVGVALNDQMIQIGPGAAISSTLTLSPCHGPGLTLSKGVDENYQGTYIVSPPDASELAQMYTSSYGLAVASKTSEQPGEELAAFLNQAKK